MTDRTVWLTWVIFTLTYVGLALGKVPGLSMDRAGIAFVGAQRIGHGSLLFVVLAARLGPRQVEGGKTRGLKNPAGERDTPGNAACLARQGDENGLGNLLSLARIAAPAQGGVVGQSRVAVHQGSERLFGIPMRIIAE